MPNVTYVSGATFADAANKSILCQVMVDGRDGEHPYLAADGDATSQTLFNDLKNGVYGAVAAYVAPTVALQALVAQAQAAAKSAADYVVAQVMPDGTHQAAFQNAASILNSNGGNAPSSGPLQASFNALAAAYGLSPTSFAAIVVGAQVASMTLGAALATFNTASAAAADVPAIASALATFETAISTVVTAINATFPAPITPPAAIIIAGVNA